MYERLFQPLRIGPRESRNRILFGSHTTNLAHHNLLSREHADYYAARAEGGAGIIVLEEHIVHPSDMPYERAILGYLPETVQAVSTVVERISPSETLTFVQINHNGQQSTSDHLQRELWAPSPVPDVSSREVPKQMEPAGLEAARTAALRGRQVVLYERGTTLGGTVALAAQGPGRSELQLITDYLQSELAQLSVEVHTGIEVTADMLLAQRPHTVIIATGAHTGPGLLPIPGHALPYVTDIRRVLAGEPLEGQRVVVVDETDSHGVLSTIEKLASAGKTVEVVTEDFYVGRDLVATHDLVLWKQRVLPHNVSVTSHTSVVRIEPGQVIVVDRFAEGEHVLPADVVVLGTYERPSQELYSVQDVSKTPYRPNASYAKA